MMSKPSWTPVLRGRTYCSPACGGGCLLSHYQKAVRKSEALASLLGEGWRPVVWENLGWHYRVERGQEDEQMVMHCSSINSRDYYWLSFTVGSYHLTVADGSPKSLVAEAQRQVQATADRLLEVLHRFQGE